MTKLTPPTTSPQANRTKVHQSLLQTLDVLYRSVVLGRGWDRFETNLSNDSEYPYLLRSCGTDPAAITVEQHVLHRWQHTHQSPFISFAQDRVAALWYNLKQEYMRMTYGTMPGQEGRFAPRALYKVVVKLEDVQRLVSTSTKVNHLATAMGEFYGTLRVRVKSYEEVYIPERLKCASFAWFAATYRCYTELADGGLSYKLDWWRQDMEMMALALQDQELMDIFEVTAPNQAVAEESSSDDNDDDGHGSDDTSGDSGDAFDSDSGQDRDYCNSGSTGHRGSDATDASVELMFDCLMKLQD